MELNNDEAYSLFKLRKFPCEAAKVEFPLQGQFIEIELQNETGRIKFQADLNRANRITSKVTFQLRHKKIFVIRRLDLNGNHKNPPAPAPDALFEGFEDYVFRSEDHVHFYVDGYNERWALPLRSLQNIGVLETDDIYEKMIKFFKYCQVENLELKITNNLFL